MEGSYTNNKVYVTYNVNCGMENEVGLHLKITGSIAYTVKVLISET